MEGKVLTYRETRTNPLNRLSENYALAIKFSHEYGIPYDAGSNAAFFIWADLGSVVQQRRFSKK
jgi:hypothetical protein